MKRLVTPFLLLASEILCRTPDGAPHVRDRAIVEAQALVRLLEVTPDDVDERFPTHHCVGIEGVDVVDGNHAGSHVPLVIQGALVRLLDVVVGLIVRPEIPPQRYFVGRRMVRHMCAVGLLSKPKPSSGCLK